MKLFTCSTTGMDKTNHIDFMGMNFNDAPIVLVQPGSQSGVVPEAIATISRTDNMTCDIIGKDSKNTYINVLAIPQNITSDPSNPALLAGKKLKNNVSVDLIHNSNEITSNDPVVILSPFWEGSQSPVEFIDTVCFNSSSETSVVSSNRGENYYVNSLVLNQGVNTYSNVDSGQGNNVNITIAAGIANKTGPGELRIYYGHDFGSDSSNWPKIFVSPWWDKKQIAVGYVETVVDVQRDYFVVNSQNRASDYFVNWVAIAQSSHP